MNEMCGVWANRRTGQKIQVSGYQEDGETMLMVTNIGIIPLSDLADYEMMGDEDFGTQGLLPEANDAQIMAAINKGVSAEDRIKKQAPPKVNKEDILNKPIEKNEKSTATVVTMPEMDNNQKLIKKVFDKYPDVLSVEFTINEETWPKNELEMLINIFEISKDEIADYIVTHYLNNELMKKDLKEYVGLQLNK